MKNNPYKLLGVDSEADDDIIKAAYRTVMKRKNVHPDLGGNVPLAQEINEAYGILRDKQKRRELDEELRRNGNIGTSESKDQKVLVVCTHCKFVNDIPSEKLLLYAFCGNCNRPFVSPDESTHAHYNHGHAQRYESTSYSKKEYTKKEKASSSKQNNSLFASYLFQKGLYQRALEVYAKLMEENITNAEYPYRIGRCYYKMKKYFQSSEMFHKAERIDSNNFLAKFWLAKSLIKEKKTNTALDYLKSALRLSPHNLDCIALLGTCYFNTGNYHKAIEYLRMVVNEKPSLYHSVYWLALSYFRINQFALAKAYFESGKKLFPNLNNIDELIKSCKSHL